MPQIDLLGPAFVKTRSFALYRSSQKVPSSAIRLNGSQKSQIQNEYACNMMVVAWYVRERHRRTW